MMPFSGALERSFRLVASPLICLLVIPLLISDKLIYKIASYLISVIPIMALMMYMFPSCVLGYLPFFYVAILIFLLVVISHFLFKKSNIWMILAVIFISIILIGHLSYKDILRIKYNYTTSYNLYYSVQCKVLTMGEQELESTCNKLLRYDEDNGKRCFKSFEIRQQGGGRDELRKCDQCIRYNEEGCGKSINYPEFYRIFLGDYSE